MNISDQLERLLKQNGFQLVRSNKHKVYRNPDGKIFITPKTPSDWRWARNALKDLRQVIANPAKPEVLTIADFEREESIRIAKQEKQPKPRAGSQRKSSGTGFSYIDKKVTPLTPEQRTEQARQSKQAAQRSDAKQFGKRRVKQMITSLNGFVEMYIKERMPDLVASAHNDAEWVERARLRYQKEKSEFEERGLGEGGRFRLETFEEYLEGYTQDAVNCIMKKVRDKIEDISNDIQQEVQQDGTVTVGCPIVQATTTMSGLERHAIEIYTHWYNNVTYGGQRVHEKTIQERLESNEK